MNLTRRIFARSAPMAAVAGGVALGNGVGSLNTPRNIGVMATDTMQMVVKDPMSGPRHLFREAMQKRNNPTHYARQVQSYQQMSPNIEALRSVSKQHKIRMMFDHIESLDVEQNTWAKKIADAVGFTEFSHIYDLY